MGAIRDKLNSIAKNERLFSLNELYDNQDIPWNEYFTELVKKVQVMSDEEFALYVEQGDESLCDSLGVSRQDVDAAELLLKDIESFHKIKDGIISDYIRLSKSRVEDI